MSKPQATNEQLNLAIYLLRKRMHAPIDLLKYWAVAGPCVEDHPSLEDYTKDCE